METRHGDSQTSATLNTIIARHVTVSERFTTLPQHFGRRMLTFEGAVYSFMRRFASQYGGGVWEFYELSNGGFYMVPEGSSFQFCVDTNGYEGVMSADAAGITVCLFAYSHLSFQDPRNGFYSDHFYRLREFAMDHTESREIFGAID